MNVILPVLTYVSETWILSNEHRAKLEVTARQMQRSMLGITRKDRKTEEWIESETAIEYVGSIVFRKKCKLFGNIARIQHDRWTKILTDWCLPQLNQKEMQKVKMG